MPKRRAAVACALAALVAFALSPGHALEAPRGAPPSAATPPEGIAAPPKIEPARLREDFRIARQSLEEGHAGIYRYTPKAEMDRVFAATEASLNRPLDAFEFYRVLAPAVAAVKCGHTGTYLPDALRSEINNSVPVLPLQIRVLGERIYVLRDFAARRVREATLAGSEILSVNGVTAPRLLATMLAAAPGDGDIQTSRRLSLGGWGFGGRLVTLLGLHGPYELVVRDAGAKSERKVRVEGITLPELREAAAALTPQDRPAAPAAEFKLMDGGRIALMIIRGFNSSAGGGKSMKEFYRESFNEMRDRKSRALIIDLRNNGGGDDELGMLLLSYLLDKPFKYYDDLVLNSAAFSFARYMSQPLVLPPASLFERRADGRLRFVGHPNWGVHRPSAPGFSGAAYVLIDGGSFSTTAEFASQAHSHRLAVFIGEESGGAYYGNTSGGSARVTLPNTRLFVDIPLLGYYVAVRGDQHPARGVMPDHPVGYSIGDLLAGADKEMALALELARRKLPARRRLIRDGR